MHPRPCYIVELRYRNAWSALHAWPPRRICCFVHAAPVPRGLRVKRSTYHVNESLQAEPLALEGFEGGPLFLLLLRWWWRRLGRAACPRLGLRCVAGGGR